MKGNTIVTEDCGRQRSSAGAILVKLRTPKDNDTAMMRLPPVQEGRRVDSVATLLRRAIIEGHIKPGERFPSERDMATQLRVGRIVVREALRSLETSGMVSIRRGVKGGSFVQEFGPDQVSKSFSDLLQRAPISLENLLEVRLALEGAILRAVMQRATPEDLQKIDLNLAESRVLLENGAAPELKSKVHEFHTLLADLTQNPLLGLLMRAVVTVIEQYMEALGFASIVSRKTIKEHEEIYQFLVARDPVKALKALEDHLAEDNQRLAKRAQREHITHIQLPHLP